MVWAAHTLTKQRSGKRLKPRCTLKVSYPGMPPPAPHSRSRRSSYNAESVSPPDTWAKCLSAYQPNAQYQDERFWTFGPSHGYKLESTPRHIPAQRRMASGESDYHATVMEHTVMMDHAAMSAMMEHAATTGQSGALYSRPRVPPSSKPPLLPDNPPFVELFRPLGSMQSEPRRGSSDMVGVARKDSKSESPSDSAVILEKAWQQQLQMQAGDESRSLNTEDNRIDRVSHKSQLEPQPPLPPRSDIVLSKKEIGDIFDARWARFHESHMLPSSKPLRFACKKLFSTECSEDFYKFHLHCEHPHLAHSRMEFGCPQARTAGNPAKAPDQNKGLLCAVIHATTEETRSLILRRDHENAAEKNRTWRARLNDELWDARLPLVPSPVLAI
jgi:hypothetical protein